MCNRYRNPNELRQLPRDLQSKVVLPPSNVSEMFPGYFGPVIRNAGARLEAVTMRWGFPTYAPGKRDPSKTITTYWTNARHLEKSMWRKWVESADHRCLVPVVDFAEPDPSKGKGGNTWFGMADGDGFCFAGIWKPTNDGDHFAFLTCQPNQLVGAIHPKAMPTILKPDDYDRWLSGCPAIELQKPLPEEMMRIAG